MGAFERLPDDQRVGRKMMSPSKLIDMRESAKYFYSKHILKEIEREETAAMRLGTMIHMAVLEPDKFKQEYSILQDKSLYLNTVDEIKDAIINLGSKPIKGVKSELTLQLLGLDPEAKVWENYLANEALSGKQLLTADQANVCKRVNEEVSKHQWLSRAIKGGVYEQAGWFDHASGLTFSFRLDYYNPNMGTNTKRPVVIDLKCTTIQNPWRFQKHIHDMGWAVQAYAYVEGVRQITGITPDYVWAVIEPQPPYRISTYAADDALIEQGKNEFLKLCHEYLNCLDTNKWDDFTAGRVVNISLPSYALEKNHDSFYSEFE